MSETPMNQMGRPTFIRRFLYWLFRRQTQSRALVVLAAFATLVAAFYLEENWRGKRAWENCRRELEAKGMLLDWNAYIPPAVPDDQNFFKAPKMQEWFVKNPNATRNELNILVTNADKTATITDKTAAANFLAWSDQLQPDFDLMREALKRPYARMDGDYSIPYEIPIPNFVAVRTVVQVLAQRAKCDLLLGQPDKALQELSLMHDMCRLLEGAPTGKPITLVSAMINVAVTGLYADTIANGFQTHAWQEPQIAALQKQLQQINVMSFVVQAFESEPAATTHTLETIPTMKVKEWFQVSVPGSQTGSKISLWQKIKNLKWTLLPRGWIYQNMATIAKLGNKQLGGFDSQNDIIQPQKFGDLTRELNVIAKPYKFFAAEAIPNFAKAWQTTVHNQTMVNEAQIACALERYQLAQGEYPETLDVLIPQFIEKMPHDIIGGEPLHYHRTDDGKFLLYSVGWNETDDGGQVVLTKDGSVDRENGDWVWQYLAK
jgi:hypothetical protein